MKQRVKHGLVIGLSLGMLAAVFFLLVLHNVSYIVLYDTVDTGGGALGLGMLGVGILTTYVLWTWGLLGALSAYGACMDLRAIVYRKAPGLWRGLGLACFGVVLGLFLLSCCFGLTRLVLVLPTVAAAFAALAVVLRVTVGKGRLPVGLPRAKPVSLAGLVIFAVAAWVAVVVAVSLGIGGRWYGVFVDPIALLNALAGLYLWVDLLLACRAWLSQPEPIGAWFAGARAGLEGIGLIQCGVIVILDCAWMEGLLGRPIVGLHYNSVFIYVLIWAALGLLCRGAGRLVLVLHKRMQATLSALSLQRAPEKLFSKKLLIAVGTVGSLVFALLWGVSDFVLHSYNLTVAEYIHSLNAESAILVFGLIAYWWGACVSCRAWVNGVVADLRAVQLILVGVCLAGILCVFFLSVSGLAFTALVGGAGIALCLSLWLDFQENKGIKAALEGAEPPEEKTK